MLPTKRVSVGQLWHMLTSNAPYMGDQGKAKAASNGHANPAINIRNGRDSLGVRNRDGTKRARSQGRKVSEGMWWSK